jgi:hypothetical protein
MPKKRCRAQRELDESSSDDDALLLSSAIQIVSSVSNVGERRPDGSIPGHRVIFRDREGGHQRMFQDYLADNPTYGEDIFRRRYMV